MYTLFLPESSLLMKKNKGNLTFVAVSSIIRYIIWRFKWQRKKVFIMLTTNNFYKQ